MQYQSQLFGAIRRDAIRRDFLAMWAKVYEIGTYECEEQERRGNWDGLEVGDASFDSEISTT